MLPFQSKTLIQASFWVAAVAVGVTSVLFEEVVHSSQALYHLAVEVSPWVGWLGTPLLFLISATVVRSLSVHATGSGIPQALKAMMMGLGSYQTTMRSGLISIRTALVKVLSASLALAAGASIGREGPTVQISTALFAWVGSKTKRIFPHADFHSYLVAGSAAGVAAAFNTPLAGISFAIEEMAEGSFAQIKQSVMISVIVAGIVAHTLVGNYTYFGHPDLPFPGFEVVFPAMTMGVVGGILGGLFAKALTLPIRHRLRIQWWQLALLCGLGCAALNALTDHAGAGTGYEITRDFMDAPDAAGQLPLWFPVVKLLTTWLSYLSGMAGGIFSPSLAIGAGMGFSVGKILGLVSLKTCALLGMVGFFTGVVQAPLTAVIIVMEMTDIHELIIPLMISAFLAQGISRLLMPVSLYRYLAHHKKY